jgi:putative oxidoreductase
MIDSRRLMFPALRPLYEWGSPFAWTLIRVMLGLWLIPHGYAKLFQADAVPASRNFVNFGWAYPLAWAYFIGFVEFVGGIFLTLGLATRLVSLVIAVEMAVISFAVLYPNWAWGKRGMEYALMMAIIAVALVFRGGGRWSVDNRLPKEI